MKTSIDKTNCTRCKGKGYGSWVVQGGVCFACNGRGTRAAQLAQRAEAKARAAYIAAIEPISVTVVGVTGEGRDGRREATRAFCEAFGLDHSMSFFIEVEPGSWAPDQPQYLNVTHERNPL